jgi:HK97 family phage major capsid protein
MVFDKSNRGPEMNPIIEAGRADQRAKANEFIAVARHLILARGDKVLASKLAESRSTERVKTILKSSASAGGVTIGTWGSQIAEYPGIVAAFLESLNSYGAFDAMLSSMRRVPLHSRVSVVTVGASGTTVGESQATPISSLTLAAHSLAIYKSLAIVVVTNELLKIGDPFANALFADELRNAVAVETDRQFLSLITSGISPTASNGGTSIAILQDLAGLAAAITTDNTSKLFIIVEPATAKAWAFKTNSTGEIAFPQMAPQGGTIGGVPVIVSGGTPSNSIVMADAHQIAAASDTIEMSASNQALLELQTAPSSPPVAGQVLQSLWQQNETALRATRYFGAERLRDTGIAVINNVSYTGNSPA